MVIWQFAYLFQGMKYMLLLSFILRGFSFNFAQFEFRILFFKNSGQLLNYSVSTCLYLGRMKMNEKKFSCHSIFCIQGQFEPLAWTPCVTQSLNGQYNVLFCMITHSSKIIILHFIIWNFCIPTFIELHRVRPLSSSPLRVRPYLMPCSPPHFSSSTPSIRVRPLIE